MAVSTDSQFSNSLVSPQAGADVNIFHTHSTPRLAVGHKISLSVGMSMYILILVLQQIEGFLYLLIYQSLLL